MATHLVENAFVHRSLLSMRGAELRRLRFPGNVFTAAVFRLWPHWLSRLCGLTLTTYWCVACMWPLVFFLQFGAGAEYTAVEY